MKKQPEMTEVGEVFAGRFRVERHLGSGGMAEVWEATDLARRTNVAVKILRSEAASVDEVVTRFRREGEVLRDLRHPALVSVETFGQLDDGRTFIVMELLQGETLGEFLRNRERVAIEDLSAIAIGMCDGLQKAHDAGIVHRDLKPDNIFLSVENDGNTQVKLLDFGISKVYGSDRLTATGQVLGTPRYMAPEQLLADSNIDARVDIYAMGVILYECLAGAPPFNATSASELVVAIIHGDVIPLKSRAPNLPDKVRAVVERCMSLSRQARYETADDFIDAWMTATGVEKTVEMPAVKSFKTAPMATGEPSAPRGGTEAEGIEPGTFSEADDAADNGSAPEPDAKATAKERPSARPVGETKDTATTQDRPNKKVDTGPVRLPLANRTWLFVVGALMAAGISFALVVLMLQQLK